MTVRRGLGRLGGLLLIRRGEGATVGYFFLFFVLMGAGMALGRGTTDALFFKRYGIEYLPVMYVLLGILLVVVSIPYAALVDRLPAERFSRQLYAGLVLLVAGSWGAMQLSDSALIYPAYFLIYEIASELLLVHTGLYLAQNLDTLQAKRIAPLVLAGSQVGMLLGGLVLALAASWLGVENILLLWVGIILLSIGLMARWHRRHGTSPFYRASRPHRRPLRDAAVQVLQGIRFTRDSALLRNTSLALFFMIITFYILSYSVNRVYTERFTSEEELSAFFGLLTAINGLLALMLQILITNRLIDRIGVRGVNLLHPGATVLASLGLLILFGLPAAIVGSLSIGAIMKAFRNPVSGMFYNVLPQTLQGRARAMEIVLVLPVALISCGAILWLLQQLHGATWFLLPGALAAGLYLFYSRRMNRAYVDALLDNLRGRLFLPDQDQYAAMKGSGEEVFQILTQGVQQADEQVSLSFARALAGSFPQRAPEVIVPRLAQASHHAADQLIHLLAPLQSPLLHEYLWTQDDWGDDHLRATCLSNLLHSDDPRISGLIQQALHAESPRLQAVAVRGILSLPLDALRAQAMHAWHTLLHGDVNQCLAAMTLIAELEQLDEAQRETFVAAYRQGLMRGLQQADDGLRTRLLAACIRWRCGLLPELEPVLEAALDHANPRLRANAAQCLHLLPEAASQRLLWRALDDGHQKVRHGALSVLYQDDEDYTARGLRWLCEERLGTPRAQQALLEALIAHGLSAEALARVAHIKGEEALQAQQILTVLRRSADTGHTGLALLEKTLTQRVQELAELVLSASQSSADADTMAVVRAGLRSGDRRHVANATEALRNLHDNTTGRLLSGLLEDHRDMRKSNRDTSTLMAGLQWCLNRHDPWLQSCAGLALQSLPTRSG